MKSGFFRKLIPKNMKRALIIKSLVWRIFISMPVGCSVTYLYFGHFWQIIEISILLNIICTILYYLYDIIWARILWNTKNNDTNIH